MPIDQPTFTKMMAAVASAEAKLSSAIHAVNVYVQLVLTLPPELTVTLRRASPAASIQFNEPKPLRPECSFS
jgi:hypothetical protein